MADRPLSSTTASLFCLSTSVPATIRGAFYIYLVIYGLVTAAYDESIHPP